MDGNGTGNGKKVVEWPLPCDGDGMSGWMVAWRGNTHTHTQISQVSVE